MRKIVKVRTSFEALHAWPDCNIEEVQFLASPHRHVFHVMVEVECVEDREVEFFMLKRETDSIIHNLPRRALCAEGIYSYIPMSCEAMAEFVFSEMQKRNYNIVAVEVWEDGENGARVEPWNK